MNDLPIGREDVLKVANDLGFLISEKQVNQVLERYPSAEDEDPGGTWNLIVEQILYEMEFPKAKYFYREIKERNGEYEYSHRSTLIAKSKEDADKQLNDLCKNWYGGAKDSKWEEDGGWYHNGGEVYVRPLSLNEVSKMEYDILRKYIY